MGIHLNFNDMNAKEFLKKEGINEVDEGCLHFDDDAEWVNERILTEMLEKYHQAKLKLLGIPRVIECLQQVNDTLERHGKVEVDTDLHNKIRNTL